MEPTSAEGKDPSWTRSQFNVRLTKRRRRQLEEVAASMPPSSSAVDAIDRALDLALGSAERDGGERIDLIEEGLRRLGELTGAGLSSVASEVRRLRELISDAAGEPEDGGEPQEDSGARPFREWLESELRRRGMEAARYAIANASWSGKSRQGAGRVSMEFMAELSAADGAAAPAGTGGQALVRFDGIGDGEAFATLDRHASIRIQCKPADGGGWTAQAFSLRSGSAPAVLLASTRI